VAGLVEQGIAAGWRCLVHVLAGSKTGLFAPSFDAVDDLRQRFGQEIDIVVDACQMRLAPERIRACLAAGWMVLSTGSKFFGGPPFAGALLVPADIAARAESASLAAGLAGYFRRPEWPRPLQREAACLPDTANLGLVLRWQAALWEVRALQAVPEDQRLLVMTELGAAVRDALEGARCLRQVAVETSGGGRPQTIFPFEVLRAAAADSAQPMDLGMMRQIHRWLNADISRWLPPGTLCSARRLGAPPCHVGQPVGIGSAAVLRVCIGAHLVWEVVRKAELIAQYYDALCAAAAAATPARSA
jgi:hypothetical protein